MAFAKSFAAHSQASALQVKLFPKTFVVWKHYMGFRTTAIWSHRLDSQAQTKLLSSSQSLVGVPSSNRLQYNLMDLRVQCPGPTHLLLVEADHAIVVDFFFHGLQKASLTHNLTQQQALKCRNIVQNIKLKYLLLRYARLALKVKRRASEVPENGKPRFVRVEKFSKCKSKRRHE